VSGETAFREVEVRPVLACSGTVQSNLATLNSFLCSSENWLHMGAIWLQCAHHGA
jgi:hypothetical protein